jgi:hypothetical protein
MTKRSERASSALESARSAMDTRIMTEKSLAVASAWALISIAESLQELAAGESSVTDES